MEPSSELEVHLIRIAAAEAQEANWADRLSPEECRKMMRFVRPVDQLRFGVTRAWLRRELGKRLGVESQKIGFVANRFGKPALAPDSNPRRLRFSVSHSGDYALVGFAWGRVIGVDVEADLDGRDYREIAGAACNVREIAEIEQLPEAERRLEVLRYWTLKEAYLKALGTGLSFPPQNVEVRRTGEGRRVRSVLVRGNWSIFAPADLAGYATAIAVAGRAGQWRLQRVE